MTPALTFEDVLLKPQYSDIASRADIDISQEFLDMKFKLPIISANMDYVTELDMAKAMHAAGGFYVLHRFYNESFRFWDNVDALAAGRFPVSISIGVRDIRDQIEMMKMLVAGFGPHANLIVTVDVAHGHHARVEDAIKRLKLIGVQHVIAGNVATWEGYRFLWEAGADAVKVGIGPGSVCTTREVAGVGVPQISALREIHDYRYGEHWDLEMPSVIADGGMKSSGDIVKALAAGADMVMLGSLLAGTQEAPGERRIDTDGIKWKRYRGQSIFGINASHYTPEGVDGWVKENGPVAGVLERLGAGIRSGMSYVGARNIKELQDNPEFIQITHAGYSIESATRVRIDE